MSLIRAVQISNFRSIDFDIFPVHDYAPLIGLNSSGKSNVLRALNLYFNDSIDEKGSRINWARDRSDYNPRNEGIGIAVEFVTGEMTLRAPQRELLSRYGLGETVAILKSWSFDPVSRQAEQYLSYSPSLEGGWTEPATELRSTLLGVVRSIAYRFIPNHARPDELVRQQLQQIRPELIQRLRSTDEYRSGRANSVLEELARLGQRMFAPTVDAIRDGSPNIDVSAEFPTDFADLAFEMSVQAIAGGGGFRDLEMTGSGTQSFIHLHFLDMADRINRKRGFGWVQGSLWALEEPESFLHAGLRARYSSDLLKYSKWTRRQVMFSTHQDEFVQQADNALFISHVRGRGTRIESLTGAEAIARSVKASVTTFRHPLLQSLDVPLVIVEGKFDELHIRAAIAEAGIRPRWRVVAPDKALQDGTSGSGLIPYLRYSKEVLASRPSVSPVLVLRDWEDKDLAKYQQSLKVHEYSAAVRCPEDLANPALGRSFVGIERFLSVELVKAVIDGGDLMTPTTGEEILELRNRGVLDQAKKEMARRVGDEGYPVGDFMIGLVRWLDEQVNGLLKAVPAEDFATS